MADLLWAESVFGAHTGEGLVELRRGNEIMAQLTPDEARAFALTVLECAEASEQDAFLMHFLEKRVGVSDLERRASVLKDFREWREAHANRGGGADGQKV